MLNSQIMAIFEEMADILEILQEDRFRVNSYRKAARVVKEVGEDLSTVAGEGRLLELPGIGKTLAEKINEFIESGEINAHQELLEQVPEGLPDMLAIPGMGPKGVRAVWQELQVGSIDQLRGVIEDGRLEELAGFGKKKVESIARGIDFLQQSQGRVRLYHALSLAELVVGALRGLDGVEQIELAGSLRRGCETVGDVDILACANDGETLIQRFTQLDGVQDVLAAGKTKGSVRYHNPQVCDETMQIDLRIVPAESFGAAWQYFTGSKAHNVHLREIAVKNKLKLNEYGLYKGKKLVAGKTEKQIYQKLGLTYVPPTLREDRGEIEAAQKNALPDVVQLTDMRGDLHMHTRASDGRAEIEDQIAMAKKLGYEYIAITDHSKSSVIANGLDADRLLRHVEQVRKLNEQTDGLTVLAGSEVDILTDGSLDYDDAILEQLDFVVASIHSGQQGDAGRNTDRVLQAMENPYVNCIAHPTGRIIHQREPMQLDMEAIFAKGIETGTALEISAAPKRLDLNDIHCRQAMNAGVNFLINTDSHDAWAQPFIQFGVATAQRGWVTKDRVMNTLPLKALLKWIKQKRAG